MKKIFGIFVILYSCNAFAYYTATIQNQCGTSYDKFYAVFEPTQYNCSSGQYLPANTDGCRTCPSDFTCNGGTFTFNETIALGLHQQNGDITHDLTNACAKNISHYMKAIFVPNQHTCAPGYYLPANTDGCTICPENNKCIGGTYTFNETIDQGIEQCTTEPHAPIGSDRCYPHILHINEEKLYMKSVKGTTPSLNAGVPGVDVCYANMVTTPTKLNKDSTHELRAIYEGIDYWICDDTICPDAE